MKIWFQRIGVISLIAFSLHFLWELSQCNLFFIHLQARPTWAGMLLATGGDVLLTWMAYAGIAAVKRDAAWISAHWTWQHGLLLEGLALMLSLLVEAYALRTGRWAYTPLAPTIAGISLVPVLQLLLLFPLTFWLAKKLLFRFQHIKTIQP